MRFTSTNTMVLGVALALAVGGCGGAGAGAGVPAGGPMPDGGSFTGVWHSPQYGEMHLVQTGSSVVGEYTKDERRGRIQGTAQGNILRFEWSEQREMVAQRPNVTRGRGYFQYVIGEDGDHYIRGRWGVDQDVTGGGEWNAARDRRRQPRQAGAAGASSSSGDEDSNVQEFDRPD